MYIAYGYPALAPPPLLAEHAAAGIDFSAGRRGRSEVASAGWARPGLAR
jgi:hypothetical protein